MIELKSYFTCKKEQLARKIYEKDNYKKDENFCLHTTSKKVIDALEKMRTNKRSDTAYKKLL